MTTDPRSEALFLIVVSQFRDAALLSMGLAPHPVTGKEERNLEAARLHIDILGMLQEKTEGHLSEGESGALQNALTEVRLRFVEERGKGDQPEASGESQEGESPAVSKEGTEQPDGPPAGARSGDEAERKEDEGVAQEETSGQGEEEKDKGDPPSGD
jgi:hypothetical protein